MGLSKREILDDYYPGELEIVFEEYNRLHELRNDDNGPDAEALGF